MGQIINATSAYVEDNNSNKVNISGINLNKQNLTPMQQIIKNATSYQGLPSWSLPSSSTTTDKNGLTLYTSSYTMPCTVNDIYYNSPCNSISVKFTNTDSNLGYWGANSYYGSGSSDPNATFSGMSPNVSAYFPLQSLMNGQTVSVTGWSSNNQYVSYIYMIIEASVQGNVLTVNYGFFYSNANSYISSTTNSQFANGLLNGVIPPNSSLNSGFSIGGPSYSYPLYGNVSISY